MIRWYASNNGAVIILQESLSIDFFPSKDQLVMCTYKLLHVFVSIYCHSNVNFSNWISFWLSLVIHWDNWKHQLMLSNSLVCRSCHLDRVMTFDIGVKFWMFIYFFVYSLIEKVGQIALQFSLWSYPTFSKPYRWPKMCFISKQIIWYSTPISTFDALSKWHDPHIDFQLHLVAHRFRCD